MEKMNLLNNNELVSVIVPVYNGEKYIKQCVEQIKAQTYRNLEVIFVNDGSTDNSSQICSQVIADDPRFRLIDKENGGTATTRNKGLDYASGTYITFLDCDDGYDPNLIEQMVFEMVVHNADLVICGYYFKIEKEIEGGIVDTVYLEEKKYPYRYFPTFDSMRDEYIALWDSDMMSNVWNKLYRMETIKKYGMRYRDGHVYTEDRVFNRQFLSKCKSIVIMDKCLYYYIRERTGSTTEKYRSDSFTIRDKEYNEFKVHFKEMHIWNSVSREYTSREFVERIAGCIENVFHAEKTLKFTKKYMIIHDMISHPDVREAIKYAKCRSKKMKIFVIPIRWNWTFGAYLMGWMIYQIRKSNPVLFHSLKSKR